MLHLLPPKDFSAGVLSKEILDYAVSTNFSTLYALPEIAAQQRNLPGMSAGNLPLQGFTRIPSKRAV